MEKTKVDSKKKRFIILGAIGILLILIIVLFYACNKTDPDNPTGEFQKTVTVNRWEYEVKEPTYDPDTETLTFVLFRRTKEHDLELLAPGRTVYLGAVSDGNVLEHMEKDVRDEFGIVAISTQLEDGYRYHYAEKIVIENVPSDFKFVTLLVTLPDTYLEEYIAPEYLEQTDNLEELHATIKEKIIINKSDCK